MFKCSDKLDALANYLMQACLIRYRCFISMLHEMLFMTSACWNASFFTLYPKSR